MRRVLVTGGAGFLGSHVVDALLARGERVRVLARPTTDRRYLDASRVEIAAGDVGDESAAGETALAEACRGVDLVIHGAGVTAARDEAVFRRVNAGGTARLARAAAREGVPRVVFLSSQAAGGPSGPDRPRREADPDRPVGAYGRSKLEAEALLAGEAVRAGFTHAVLRPPPVYGPRDRAFLILFRMAARGFLVLHRPDRQQLSVVHVRDVVQGVLLAAARAPAAHAYYLTDGVIRTTAAVAQAIASALGKKPLRLDLPYGILKGVFWGAETWAGLSGRPARLTRERLVEWTAPCWTLDDGRAREELGYAPEVDLARGMEETVLWYRNAGWI